MRRQSQLDYSSSSHACRQSPAFGVHLECTNLAAGRAHAGYGELAARRCWGSAARANGLNVDALPEIGHHARSQCGTFAG